jgi:membrane-associated phospholipid phosphatase
MGRRFAILACLLTASATAHAEPATRKVDLRYDTSADVFIIGTGVYVAVMFQAAIEPPDHCRWCTPPSFDAKTRNALVWKDTTFPEQSGNLSTFVAGPIAAIGLTSWAAAADGRSEEMWANDLIIAEATMTSVALTQAVKPMVARARPAVYYDTHDWRAFPRREVNGSFFSGHTSTSFALAVSSGTVASMRGYRLAPLVWGVGLPLAVFTGYSRIAADAHYLSDVVVGAAVGAGIGFSMPFFIHSPKEQAVAWHPVVLPVAGGAAPGVAGWF